MPNVGFIWDLDDDLYGNVEKLAQHGLTPEDVIFAVLIGDDVEKSDSSGRPLLWGETSDGRLIAVSYEHAGNDIIYVVTTYEPNGTE